MTELLRRIVSSPALEKLVHQRASISRYGHFAPASIQRGRQFSVLFVGHFIAISFGVTARFMDIRWITIKSVAGSSYSSTTSTAGRFSICTRNKRSAMLGNCSTLPSHRETTPLMPARLVLRQFAHRPKLAFCANPVRTWRALTKNRRARSKSETPCAGEAHAMANSSREKGVNPIASISSFFRSRKTRKKLTTSPSRSLYVSTSAGTRLMRTAAEPPNGSQYWRQFGRSGSSQSRWLYFPPYHPNARRFVLPLRPLGFAERD